MKLDLLGVQTDAQTFDESIQQLMAWVGHAEGHYVCTCPVYTLMQCRENPAVMQAVNAASMATADGMPIVWMQRRLGHPGAERVYGPDLMLALCDAGQARGLSHYFYGSTPPILDQLTDRLRARFPQMDIAGTHAPPFGPPPDAPDPAVVDRLNASGADVIWVGLGSPKQGLWMATYRPHLKASLLIGVGAAFEILSESRAQAPRWMQRSGLEWTFRLALEPRRLWRRYLVYNPRFVWAVMRTHWRDLLI